MNNDILKDLGVNDLKNTDYNQRKEYYENNKRTQGKKQTKEEFILNMGRIGKFDDYLLNTDNKYITEQTILASRKDISFKELSLILANTTNKDTILNVLRNKNIQYSDINKFMDKIRTNNFQLTYLVKNELNSKHLNGLSDLNKKYLTKILENDKTIKEENKNKNEIINSKTKSNNNKKKEGLDSNEDNSNYYTPSLDLN